MVRQQIYQIAWGYEDCNDAEDLRFDPLLKTAVGRLGTGQHPAAGRPGLCPARGISVLRNPGTLLPHGLITNPRLQQLAEP